MRPDAFPKDTLPDRGPRSSTRDLLPHGDPLGRLWASYAILKTKAKVVGGLASGDGPALA